MYTTRFISRPGPLCQCPTGTHTIPRHHRQAHIQPHDRRDKHTYNPTASDTGTHTTPRRQIQCRTYNPTASQTDTHTIRRTHTTHRRDGPLSIPDTTKKTEERRVDDACSTTHFRPAFQRYSLPPNPTKRS